MGDSLGKVLVVDDDAAVREALVQTLELNGFTPLQAASFVVAKDHITPDFDGVVLSDIRMPGRDGFHLLGYAREVDAELPVVMLTGEGDIPMAVRAIREGAYGFLEKPCKAEDLLPVLARALKQRLLVIENRLLKAQLASGDPAARMVFGVSKLSEALRQEVRAAASRSGPVLVAGPRGSGISKIAEIVHQCSPAAQAPFEKRASEGLSRAALREAIKASEGGTLFLDEITALPSDTQLALIDAMDIGTMGGGMGARLIAGSIMPLTEAQRAGVLHDDLVYQLDVAPVRIPALSERPEDVPVLFRHYVAQAAEQAGIAAPQIPESLLAALIAQDWPGNARSVMSVAMRFVMGLPNEAFEAADLGLSEQMARVERSLLVAALERQNGHASEAAKALKLPRKTFYDKLAKHGIKAEDYRR